VNQALAYDAPQCDLRALRVRELPRVVAEVELAQVRGQVVATDVVVRADESALEGGEEALHGVGRHVPARTRAAGG